jgi:phospho-N-acetylmuramoyl-pentapeptide-transferase
LFIIVGTSNAVNLTDGLDGLAIGPANIAFGTFLLLSYLSGNAKAASYLQIPFVPGTGELSVFAGPWSGREWLSGSTAIRPRSLWGMGLVAGGRAGNQAVITKNEILLVIVGGIF